MITAKQASEVSKKHFAIKDIAYNILDQIEDQIIDMVLCGKNEVQIDLVRYKEKNINDREAKVIWHIIKTQLTDNGYIITYPEGIFVLLTEKDGNLKMNPLVIKW